ATAADGLSVGLEYRLETARDHQPVEPFQPDRYERVGLHPHPPGRGEVAEGRAYRLVGIGAGGPPARGAGGGGRGPAGRGGLRGGVAVEGLIVLKGGRRRKRTAFPRVAPVSLGLTIVLRKVDKVVACMICCHSHHRRSQFEWKNQKIGSNAAISCFGIVPPI